MSHTTISLTLPDELLDRYREAASAGKRTLEDVITETLTSYQPNIDYHALLTTLAYYKDEQLWQLVYWRLTPQQQERLDALNDKLEDSDAFSTDEQSEMKHLTDMIQHQMRLRSRALALLNERGYDTQAYLNTLEA